jgi:hypothetical protein
VVSAASDQGRIVLADLPEVHRVQLRLSELVRTAHWGDLDGTGGDDVTR